MTDVKENAWVQAGFFHGSFIMSLDPDAAYRTAHTQHHAWTSEAMSWIKESVKNIHFCWR
jgi:fatty acid desaturase